jgi:hypothetical protein
MRTRGACAAHAERVGEGIFDPLQQRLNARLRRGKANWVGDG